MTLDFHRIDDEIAITSAHLICSFSYSLHFAPLFAFIIEVWLCHYCLALNRVCLYDASAFFSQSETCSLLMYTTTYSRLNGAFVKIPNENHVSAKFSERISERRNERRTTINPAKNINSQRIKIIKIITNFLCAVHNCSAFKMQFEMICSSFLDDFDGYIQN